MVSLSQFAEHENPVTAHSNNISTEERTEAKAELFENDIYV